MNRSAKVEILETEIAAVKAQNDRLNEENVFLRDKLNRLTANTRSTAATNVEAKIRAYQLEDERDELFQNLENLKKKYNRLHEAYCEKVKRCKILESTFQQQKSLPGLVMKSAIKQKNEEQACAVASESFESQLIKQQNELDEAYDIIDALEFELETVELLEVENQRLRHELSNLKWKCEEMKKNTAEKSSSNERSPSYSEIGFAQVSIECKHRSTDSICEECVNESDVDSQVFERAILTHSVLENVEAESNILRRELLRSRLQNTIKIKQKPT